jgi:NADPH-dependent 2,4-dienoyl-CoA reductase/sulfur reductase-like enzyme/peroxiredoxin family protein/rhodanese-related sulfurtransferase/TusA-related sulfurtransferase
MGIKKRIVIVGGVAGGASAAARARRLSEEAEIILIERGEYVSFANCGLPYHIGGMIQDRGRLLVQTPESLYANLRIDVRTQTEAIAIDREKKELTLRSMLDQSTHRLSYDKLILSPGAEPIRPPIPGSDAPQVMTLRSMTDMDNIIRLVDTQKPTKSIIIGGGYIGLEMAEALRARNINVTLVELSNQVMGPIDPEMATPLHQQIIEHGVDLRLETSVVGFSKEESALQARLSTGEIVPCGIAILAIGVKPETSLARQAGLTIGERGGIVVDEHMCTNDQDIYAVGDAVEVTDLVGGFATLIPLAGPANRQGRIAADNAFGRNSTYKKTQGTGICKVFDLAAGMTGMNEKSLKRAGMAYEKVYIHPFSHAGYYPGASQMSLKMLFDPHDGRILGAQAVGADGVDKRMDVLALAIRANLTVYDLEDLELSYAPPYGSAKDPVNYAGFVAANVLRGDVAICHVQAVLDPQADQLILDVRKPVEVATGTIPGALNIPLDELRDRIHELPQDKEILVYCQVGLRGYLACRILSQKGFRCQNLSGGIKTYHAVTDKLPANQGTAITETCNDAGGPCEIPQEAAPKSASVVKVVDATGLQCPGPIMKVATAFGDLKSGDAIMVLASDPAFASDIKGWCNSTGNRLFELVSEKGHYKATIIKGDGSNQAVPSSQPSKKKTIVVFSNDFDRLMAAFIIANGAAAMGSDVTMFFTFWGLNALRKPQPGVLGKTAVEKMFGWMMPRGADKLKLSHMNLAGMGLAMLKGIMKNKHVQSLPEMISSAKNAGVHLVACTMSMGLMGIKSEELIDSVEEGGVAMYLDRAEAGNVNLFI